MDKLLLSLSLSLSLSLTKQIIFNCKNHPHPAPALFQWGSNDNLLALHCILPSGKGSSDQDRERERKSKMFIETWQDALRQINTDISLGIPDKVFVSGFNSTTLSSEKN